MCEAEGTELKVKSRGQKMGSTPGGLRHLVSTEEKMCCGPGLPFNSDKVWATGRAGVRERSAQGKRRARPRKLGPMYASLSRFHDQALSGKIAQVQKSKVKAKQRQFRPRDLWATQ